MSGAFWTLKPYVLLLYAAFGATCLGLAGVRHARLASIGESGIVRYPVGRALLFAAAALLLFCYVVVGSSLLLAASLIAPLLFVLQPQASRTPAAIACGVSTALVVLSLVWWQFVPSETQALPLAAFASIFAVVTLGLSDPGRPAAHLVWGAIAVFVVAGLAMLLDLGAFRPGQTSIIGLVHHWGAFIGPALHVRAGLIPLYDVPLQYGIGPTAVIAATCTGDCWTAAEVLFVASHLLEGLLLLAMALATGLRRGAPWIASVTLVMFAAVFLWPGYLADGSVLMGTPSSGGVRFLPLTLVACLWFFGRPVAATVAMVPALLWSPESAAMALAVYGLCGTAEFGFCKAALVSAALLCGSYLGLFLVYRAIYGVWIDPMALLEYVIHVPGPLPISLFSDALLLAATLGLAGYLLLRPYGGPDAERRDRAVTALAFATASYCLGRSHPNNVCNLAPFLVLIALRTLDRPKTDFRMTNEAAALGLAVSVAALAFSSWKYLPFEPNVVTDIHAAVAAFPAQEPEVTRLREEVPRQPALGIADFGPHFARSPTESILWTPMDPSSLWGFVPSDRRRVYIKRSAQQLRRSGWAIVAQYEMFLLDDLKSAYAVRRSFSTEGAPDQPGGPPVRYTVACLDPRPDVVPAAIGPACPPDEIGSLTSARAP